jgi:hypothetical protein
MDTPDFDTGAGGSYTNRDSARQALESADILIYIFTNANYNNRDNTDFMAEMLTRVGVRKAILVYRVYPSFEDDEVLEHALTVASNLYGAGAEEHLLGIYRADEDNEVAAGRRPMVLRAARPPSRPLDQALADVDVPHLRLELNASILADVLDQARSVLSRAGRSREAMALYLEALRFSQSASVQAALRHFPLDIVLKRFAAIWEATDPPLVKFMRRTGSVVELPLKAAVAAVRWVRRQADHNAETGAPDAGLVDQVKEDLLEAVHALHVSVLSDPLNLTVTPDSTTGRQLLQAARAVRDAAGDGERPRPRIHDVPPGRLLQLSVPAHPALRREQQRLQKRDWQAVVGAIVAQRDTILAVSDDIDAELATLAEAFRRNMTAVDHLRQSSAALLNILPATAAVTYILSTGDPVGAAGIKVKLAGLLGLQDLYALVAIPATTGLKRADRRQLESMLGPLARTWLNSKLATVERLLEAHVTGDVLRAAEEALAASEDLLQAAARHLGRCERTP